MIFNAFDNPGITAAGFIDYLDKAIGVKNLLHTQLVSQVKQSEDSLSKLQAAAGRRKDIRAMVLGQEPEKKAEAAKKKKDIYEFIEENREELVAALDKRLGKGNGRRDDEELRLWIMNDEDLYNWALSKGVEAAAGAKPMKPTGFVVEGAAGGYDAHTADGKQVAAGAATPAAAAAAVRQQKQVDAAVLGRLYEAARNLQDWCEVYGTTTVIERAAGIRDYAAKILIAEKVETPKLAAAAVRFGSEKAVARKALTVIKACVEEMNGLGKLGPETQRNANRLLESALSIEFAVSRM